MNLRLKRVAVRLHLLLCRRESAQGRQLNNQSCDRCHKSESTAERLSNFDDLEIKPHPFTEGHTLNKMSDADPTAIIGHRGPALNKSALMPSWGDIRLRLKASFARDCLPARSLSN